MAKVASVDREKKPPAERGDLSTFNEERGSQAGLSPVCAFGASAGVAA